MAKDSGQNNQLTQSPVSQGSANKKVSKKNGLVSGILAFLVAVLIIAGVLGGAFFIAVKNNFGGISDKFRNQIKGIPVINLALPKPVDPEDPKYLTPEELKTRYQELRQIRDELQKQLDESQKKQAELEKYKDEQDGLKIELENKNKELEAKQAALDAKSKQLDEDKKKIDEAAASGNKEAFAEFFEAVDPGTAKEIYRQVIDEQQLDADTKKFASIYSAMDPSSAAKIFEQLGTSGLNLTVKTLKCMNKDNSSQILASMSAKFAATVTDKMSESFMDTKASDATGQ